MSVLACLPELRTLNVSQNGGVTDKSVERLAGLPALENLNLSNTSVDPAAVPALQRLPSLTTLSLYSLGIPQSAVPQLRASLPRLLSLGLDESPQQSK